MSKTVSDFIVSRLQEWGVKRVFGYPGDGINGVRAHLTVLKTALILFRYAMRKLPLSWLAGMPSSQVK